jgi:hypothetical protein
MTLQSRVSTGQFASTMHQPSHLVPLFEGTRNAGFASRKAVRAIVCENNAQSVPLRQLDANVVETTLSWEQV